MNNRKQVSFLLHFGLVAMCLFAVGYPVLAQDDVTIIDPENLPPPLLDPAEVAKITTLQNTYDLFALSEVSPDDRTMLVGAGRGEDMDSFQVNWLNLETGELTPIDPAFLAIAPQSQAGWLDNETVIYLTYTQRGQPVQVKLDRVSGAFTQEELSIDGRPLSLAPNGSRLLYEAGSATGQDLMVLDVVTGETEKLISYANGGSPQAMAWTADGSKLAVVRYEIPSDMTPAQMDELVMQDALGNLPLAENPIFSSNVLDVYDFVTGQYQPAVFRAAADEGYLYHQVGWNTDGSRLVTRMIRPSHPAGRLHPVVLAGAFPDRAYYRIYDADLTLETALDRPEIEAPFASKALFVSPDEVIISAAHGLNVQLYYFNLLSGEFRTLPTGEGTFNDFQVSATHQTGQLIYIQSSFQSPSELYRIDLAGGEPVKLTDFNAEAAALNQIRVDEMQIEMQDGSSRIGYLLQPADAAFPPVNVPVVLYQQGGPGGAMTNRWGATVDEPFNLLPNFGFALLFMPFSGREGFGADFMNALTDDSNFGQLDIEEGAQAVQSLFDQNYTQPDKMGITGCSYGGYFASQSIIQYPDLYAAANVQCAVLDLVDWWQQNKFLVTFMEGASPQDQMEEYHRDSPAFHAAAVRTPLLLFHGTEDRLPIQTVQDFQAGIDQAQTPVLMLAFQNEDHTLLQPASKLFAAQQQIAWFREYLNP